MVVVWLIIVGAAAGFIATRIMDLHTNVITTIAIGIGGALIGGLVLRLLLGLLSIAAGFVGALLGALVLIWIWQTYFSSRR